MPCWNPFQSSKTPEENPNGIIRSTTRAIGKRLLNEPNLSPRRCETIEEELSWRIGLMRQISTCDPHAIFHYNSKGFKSFTSEYREILQHDLSNRHQYDPRPGSRFLDYNRSELERDAKEAGLVHSAMSEGRRDREVDERREENRQRMLRDRERQERKAREREEEEEEEEEEAYTRELWARDERERKSRERENEKHARNVDKRAREARETEARDHQRLRGSRQGPPDARRRDFEAEHRAQRGSRHNNHDDKLDKHQTQKSSRPDLEQGNHNKQKYAPPRQAKDLNRPPNHSQTKTASQQTGSERPPNNSQTKKASHQTISKIPNGRTQSQPQELQASRSPEIPAGTSSKAGSTRAGEWSLVVGNPELW